MVTKCQLFFEGRVKKSNVSFSKKLQENPQKKGFVKKIFTLAPKKPNSALRKVLKCVFSNGFTAITHIPGIGHACDQ